MNKEHFQRHYNLLITAMNSLLTNKTRSLIITGCLIAIIFPFISAMALSEGVKYQALISVEEGADIYLTRDFYGNNAPIGLETIHRVKTIEGVTKVIPRVIGRMYLFDKLLVVVGIPKENLSDTMSFLNGRPFQGEQEVIVGKGMADYFGLNIGSKFTVDLMPGVPFEITGIFRSSPTIWSSDVLIMSFDDAARLFRLREQATDLLVYTRPGSTETVSEELKKLDNPLEPPLRIQDRNLVKRYFYRGFNYKAGVFTALYLVAFALAIPAILITSGLITIERKREVGVLKATGWQTQEILEMLGWENFILALAAAIISILLAMVWIKVFNAAFLAQFFIAESGLLPSFQVPARFLPIPCLLSFFFAISLSMTGSLYSTWRTAIIPPVEAMR